jgi:hypothetical protein
MIVLKCRRLLLYITDFFPMMAKYLDASTYRAHPNAVLLKYICLVSNGNNIGYELMTASHQVGREPLLDINGS